MSRPQPHDPSLWAYLACTWEAVYCLTRSGRYFFDLDAIREPHRTPRPHRPQPAARPYLPAAWVAPLSNDHGGLRRLKAA